MIKIRLILIFCFFCAQFKILIAQEIVPLIEWQKCYGSSGDESVNSIIATSDGGYIFSGRVDPINDGDFVGYTNLNLKEGIWITKISASRTIEWQKIVGGSNRELNGVISKTKDGGFIMAATTYSNDGDIIGNHGNTDVWIAKFSAKGTIEWSKCLGGSDFDGANSIIQTKDGGYAIVGNTTSIDGDVTGNRSSTDGWLVKLTAKGDIEWQKVLGGSSTDIFDSFVQTKDGGYIVTGRAQSPDGDVIGIKGTQNAWVIKFSKLGVVEWQKCYGGSAWDSARSIIQTAEGGYAIAGRATSRDGDLSKKKDTSEDAWVVKLSSLGAIEWVKNLGGSRGEEANTIIQTSDGGFLMAGYTDSNDGDVKNPLGVTDGWLVKLSAQGALLWEKSYGSTNHDNIWRILPTLDGGYLLAGEGFRIDGVDNGRKELCLIKLTSDDKVIKGQLQQSNTVCQGLTPIWYIANTQVKIEKNNNTYYTSSDSLGRFGVFADTGIYSISALPPNSLWTACPPQYFTISKPRVRDTTIVNPSLYINSLCPLMEVELTTVTSTK
jgi:hypothetical protein